MVGESGVAVGLGFEALDDGGLHLGGAGVIATMGLELD